MKKRFLLYAAITLALVAMRLIFANQSGGCIQSKKGHCHNLKVLSSVIDSHLASIPPSNGQTWLSENLNLIAKEALDEGFDPSVYTYMPFGDSNYFTFTSTPLWEGESKGVNLTLFVYAWPPEAHALTKNKESHDPNNCVYLSNIHGHPISCAFTVLSRSITEICYEISDQNIVSITDHKSYDVGEGSYDNQTQSPIHQLVCKQRGETAAVTLHAYGAPTATSVKEAFSQNRDSCTYLNVIDEKGVLSKRSW